MAFAPGTPVRIVYPTYDPKINGTVVSSDMITVEVKTNDGKIGYFSHEYVYGEISSQKIEEMIARRDAEWSAYTHMPAPSEEFCKGYWENKKSQEGNLNAKSHKE